MCLLAVILLCFALEHVASYRANQNTFLRNKNEKFSIHYAVGIAHRHVGVKAGNVAEAPVQYTTQMSYFGETTKVIPAYQIMDLKGKILDQKQVPKVS